MHIHTCTHIHVHAIYAYIGYSCTYTYTYKYIYGDPQFTPTLAAPLVTTFVFVSTEDIGLDSPRC